MWSLFIFLPPLPLPSLLPLPLVVSHSNEFSSAALPLLILPCVHNFQRSSLTVRGTSAPIPLPLTPPHHPPSPHSSVAAHSHPPSLLPLLTFLSLFPIIPPSLTPPHPFLSFLLTPPFNPLLPSPCHTLPSPSPLSPSLSLSPLNPNRTCSSLPPCSSPCWTVCRDTKGSQYPVTDTQRWLRCELPSPKHG